MLQETHNVVVYYFAGSLFILLLVAAIIIYAFQHQKKVHQLRAHIFNALQEGQEKERTRVAEELHDGIGAKLSGLKMNIEYLMLNPGENNGLIGKVLSGITEALEEVREISHNLQPYFFQDKDLEQLLQINIEQLNSQNGCRYDLYTDLAGRPLDNNIKLQCYRIIAELLHNIHKHARATLASVQVNRENDILEIVVEDNGKGFRSDAVHEGIGLSNIQNRVDFCKGTMNIDSSDKGTSVILEIPLNTATI